ncbi:MAG: EscU/YscU/HrcU family type III secretion system export apparatus switch protein [Bdellovibrionota bacterium]
MANMGNGSKSDKKYSHNRAIVLEYEKGKTPIISAKGEKFIADYIIKLAKKYNKPIVKKSFLSKALYQIQEGKQIPPSLYEAVAEILYEIEKL